MKAVIAFAAILAAAAVAIPLDDPARAQILRFDSANNGDSYSFAYETSDGVARQEQGQLQNVGTEQEGIAVRGSVSWVADDGQTYTLNYIADENGFQPEGAHLPVA